MQETKTKQADTIMQSLCNVAGFETLTTPNPVNVLLVIPSKNEYIEKSFRNLAYATVRDVQSLNTLDIMKYRYIVMVSPEDCSAFLGSKKEKALSVAQA